MDTVVSNFLRRRWPGITYLLQVVLLYIVIIASIVNLSIGNGNDKVWIGLLTSCIGLLLPNPRFDPAAVLETATAVDATLELIPGEDVEIDRGPTAEASGDERQRVRILHPRTEQFAGHREQS
ncbi:MAG: hypothetical protein GY696_07135 [Gammaproteobacteria bacterium]|nr:hypothetical protein [Gammaproteobacteria bacterium]